VWIVVLSLDGLLDAHHGVAPPVEEDVGGGGGTGGGDQLLRCRLDDAVIAVKPTGVPGVVDVSDVVTLGGLPPVVVHHAEQFVLPLLAGVLALAGLTQDVPADLQVDAELHLLHDLLTAPSSPVIDKPLEVEDEDGRQFLQAEISRGLDLLFSFGADVSVQLFRGEVLSQGISNTSDVVALYVQLECEEWL